MIGTLLTLPFRIAFALINLAMRLAWIPVMLVTRHLILTIVIIGAVLVLAFCHGKAVEKQPAQLPQAPPTVNVAPQLQGAQVQRKQQAPVRVDPVMKVEDGNSAFAADLYAAMTDPERAYYSQVFFWTMNTIVDGQSYTWTNGNTNGIFTPTKTFDNRNGGTCRNFNETLKVHTVQQTLNGIACYQGNSSWCKLKANATPMCGLGGKDSTMDSLKRSLKNIF